MTQFLYLTAPKDLATPNVCPRSLAGLALGNAAGYALAEADTNGDGTGDPIGVYVASVEDGVTLAGGVGELRANGVSIGTDLIRRSEGRWWVGEPPGAEEIAAAVDFASSAQFAADVAAQLALTAIRDQLGVGPIATDRIVTRGTTWRIALPFELPATWSRLEFTARSRETDAQADSLLHVRITNPADPADGLQILLGAPAETAADAEIVTVDVATPQVTIAATATAAVPPTAYRWDAKLWTPDGIDQDGRGDLIVEPDVTRL